MIDYKLRNLQQNIESLQQQREGRCETELTMVMLLINTIVAWRLLPSAVLSP